MAKILIADDSPDLIDFLSLLLKRNGNEVETIVDTNDLQEKLAAFTPDIVLMDVRLQYANGREICRQIKGAEKTKHIKVILMSASPELLQDYKECDADGVVEKPFDLIKLYSIIETV